MPQLVMNMNVAYLLIGGNMGDREAYLALAREQIKQHCGPILQCSSLYETAAWGLEDQSSFLNQGEICLCGSRILVEESIYDRFVEAFTGRIKELHIGDPLDSETNIGALISENEY